MELTLTDADLARLEELAAAAGEGAYSAAGDGCPTIQYVVAACNAAPALVVEVRALRRHNQILRGGHKAVRGGLEAENAALRARVEELYWLREVEAVALDAYVFTLRSNALEELEATYDAAKEAIR